MRRGNKFGAVAVVVDGIRFDSKIEARRWGDLQLLQRAGEISGLRRQVRFPLLVGEVVIGHYVADFVYTNWIGVDVIEDVKGHQTEIFKRSAKHMAAMGLPVTVWPAVAKKERKKSILPA